MVVFKIRDSVPSTRYSSVCNVLRLWSISLIPTYSLPTIICSTPYGTIYTICSTAYETKYIYIYIYLYNIYITVNREIFVLKIFRVNFFVGSNAMKKFYANFFKHYIIADDRIYV